MEATAEITNKINKLYYSATVIYAEASEQEWIDNLLDGINAHKIELQTLNDLFEETLNDVYGEASKLSSKKDYIIYKEILQPLYDISEKLYHQASHHSWKGCFNTEMNDFSILKEDLHELLIDLEKTIKENKKSEQLLRIN